MTDLPDIEYTPREVRWSDIGDFDQLDERVSAVSAENDTIRIDIDKTKHDFTFSLNGSFG